MREDWIECKLDECSLVLDNLRKPINSSERQNRIANKKIEDLFPYYGATGQVGYIDDYLTDGEFVLLGEDAAPFLEPTKDVAYLIQGKTWVNNHAHILSSLTNNRFLLHYLNQFNYKDYVSGTTRLKLTQGSLKSIPVKLPPLPEQRAIVKKLESLFSSLDAGVADLKKAQQQLKIYRQAVLKKAFEGELTKEWRIQENKNFTVNDIINQIEEERKKFYDFQIKAWNQSVIDWENTGKKGKKNDKPTFNEIKISTTEKLLSGAYVHFGSICNVVRGGSPRPAGDPKFYNGNIPFLKVADLTRISSKYVTEYAYTIKPAGLQKTRFLKKGTLVISNSGATLGVARILGIDATANDGIAAFLDLHPEMIEFYYYYLNSQTESLRAIDQGAGQPNLNTDLLKELLVPIFSIEEQHQIVKQIESRLSVCDSIEENIKESLLKAEAFRQSILKKAFEGNLLTAMELEECKLAEDYEPASVLLEKIKAEKEASKVLEKTISRKPKIKMDKKEILVILKENNNEMDVNQLWKGSIYENDIDAFYLKLKDLSEQGKISEIKNGKEVTIKLI